MKPAPARRERRSCCAFLSVLVLEVLAWGLAVVAITTSFWLAPTHGALDDSNVSHAGLWLSCGAPPAAPPPPPANALSAAANSIQASINNVKSDVSSALYTTDVNACSNSRTAFGDLNGDDYRLQLSVVRVLVIAFQGLGFIKVLAALGAQCTRRASSQRGSGCAAVTISAAQLIAGWGAWGLFLSVLVRTAEAADHSVTSLWGWSFWLYTAALVTASLGGGALCCA